MANEGRVFVSHSHQDSEYCQQYVNGLKGRGYAVWYDEHNLGWGALRSVIESEMQQCQHFVAIFSTAAVTSQWVNAEIDAAIELVHQGVLLSVVFVIAERCEVPLLLRRWKRLEGPGGTSISATEAVARTVPIIGLPSTVPIAP